MDKLIKIHKEFMVDVIRRCMLDQKFKYMRREFNNVIDNVLEFRKLCKKYLLSKPKKHQEPRFGGNVSMDESDDDDESNDENFGEGFGKDTNSTLSDVSNSPGSGTQDDDVSSLSDEEPTWLKESIDRVKNGASQFVNDAKTFVENTLGIESEEKMDSIDPTLIQEKFDSVQGWTILRLSLQLYDVDTESVKDLKHSLETYVKS